MFPNARITPLGHKDKDKYDPLNEAIRTTHDFSAGDPSLNDLVWIPYWLTVYLLLRMICDRIAELGRGTRVTVRDVPAAFKMNSHPARAQYLHVARIVTREFGTEYFVERAHEFGNIPSEYGWQAVIGMIEFSLAKLLPDAELKWFVDNGFEIHPPHTDAPAAAARMDAQLEWLGVPIHEQVSATTKFYALDWDMDLAPGPDCPWDMVLVCPLRKFNFYSAMFRQIASSTSLSLPAIERLVGAMQFLAVGFIAGTPSLAPLYSLRTRAQALHRKKRLPKVAVKLALDAESRAAIVFWAKFFPTWHCMCPLLQSFGPNAGPQISGRVDASGKGCGGILLLSRDDVSVPVMGFSRAWTAAELKLAVTVSTDGDGNPLAVFSSGVGEMLAIVAWLRLFAETCRGLRVLLETDSEAAYLALTRTYSPVPAMQGACSDACRTICSAFIVLRVAHLLGRLNTVSDALSRQKLTLARTAWLEIFGRKLQLA